MIFRLTLSSPKTIAAAISGVALTIGLGACGPSPTTPTATDTAPGASPAVAPGTPVTSRLNLEQNVPVSGAGATFPAPLYQRWFADFNRINPRARISYQSVGSGAGVQQFVNRTVDFGASDVAMNDEELQKVQGGVLMIPVTAGGIVFAYNLPNVPTGLRLSREVYVDILLGNIKTWNDPRLVKDNPGVNLPNLPITVVYRADGSGTTGVFTKHLSAASPTWQSKVGEGKTVAWPTGVGARGNEGVTAQIVQTAGAIGYIEYGYAKQNKITYATLQNKAGNFVPYSEQSASNALAAVELPDNLRAFIADPDGAESYPIVSYSWLLVYPKYQDPAKAKTIEAMVEYVLTEGQRIAPDLGYIPLPPSVAYKVANVAQAISPDYDIAVAPPAGTANTTSAGSEPITTTPGATPAPATTP
jgi:phosphate transport system substrate-binding protein